MAWYNKIFRGRSENVEEKLNPAQRIEGGSSYTSREPRYTYQKAYEDLEIVNRGVNMLVDDISEIDFQVGGNMPVPGIIKGLKGSKVSRLLNVEPNPFQDISTFRRNLFIDLIVDGNIFIYFDGVHLYHLPASKMVIVSSKSTYVEKYTFQGMIDYYPDEIIHIKENSFDSVYRGTSRLKPALRTMNLTRSMRSFQDNFFKNGAVPGLVLKSPNTLSEKIKERMMQSWQSRYNPESGGRRPLILDGGLEVDSISNVNFRELDFQTSIAENEKTILKAIGIPPILMDSGNNANIRPNMRMYYLETVLPCVNKFTEAMERFFGFEIEEDLVDIPSLQPELSDQAAYYSSLVNNGILAPNEARVKLGYERIEGFDDIRVPANIAGSASNPSVGGRPAESNDGED
jgi:HK97 family phage portal protein